MRWSKKASHWLVWKFSASSGSWELSLVVHLAGVKRAGGQ